MFYRSEIAGKAVICISISVDPPAWMCCGVESLSRRACCHPWKNRLVLQSWGLGGGMSSFAKVKSWKHLKAFESIYAIFLSHQKEKLPLIRSTLKSFYNSFPCMASVLRSICCYSPASQEIDQKVTPSTRRFSKDKRNLIAKILAWKLCVFNKLAIWIMRVRAQRGISTQIFPHPS